MAHDNTSDNTDKRGFASMDKDEVRKIASKGGRSQGKDNNPGNFANRSKEDVQAAAREGGSK